MLKRILLFHLHVAPDNQYCISGKGRCRRLKSLHMQKNFGDRNVQTINIKIAL